MDEYEWNLEYRLSPHDTWHRFMSIWKEEDWIRKDEEVLRRHPTVWYAIRVIRRRKPGPVEVMS